MRPAWYRMSNRDGSRDEEFADLDELAGEKSILYNPRKLLLVVLATIGVLGITQNAAQYFFNSFRNKGKAFNGDLRLALNAPRPHPLDLALTHHRNDTGFGEHGKKAIVVASTSYENTDWVHEHMPDWERNIYVVDDEHANLTVFINHGREAAVYLTYIIQHYYMLPDYVVFLHANRYQWHNEDPMFDGVQPIKNLRLEYVEKVGYTSLRCNWKPGCPSEIKPDPDEEDDIFTWHGAYTQLFMAIFPDKTLPPAIGAPCCAQFAVSASTITSNPLWKYEQVRQWLWETKLPSSKTGRIMEYLWHVLFGKEAVNCPSAEQCFCDLFGLCELECPRPALCEGRHTIPLWNHPMEKGWPYEGQGEFGWPKYGWWHKWYPNEDFGLGYIKEGMDAMAAANTTSTDTGNPVEETSPIPSGNEAMNGEKLDEITFGEVTEGGG